MWYTVSMVMVDCVYHSKKPSNIIPENCCFPRFCIKSDRFSGSLPDIYTISSFQTNTLIQSLICLAMEAALGFENAIMGHYATVILHYGFPLPILASLPSIVMSLVGVTCHLQQFTLSLQQLCYSHDSYIHYGYNWNPCDSKGFTTN